MDSAPLWGHIVKRLGSIVDTEMHFARGDVTEPLTSEVNADVAPWISEANMLLFSFVLHESVNWQDFMSGIKIMHIHTQARV